MKRLFIGVMCAAMLFCAGGMTGCDTDARVASHNISKKADMFEIDRRVVFYNGITGEYMLTIEGRLSLEITGEKLMVTVKTGPHEFKKHYLGLSDNISFFCEQLKDSEASVYRYKVIFKPTAIIPDVDLG